MNDATIIMGIQADIKDLTQDAVELTRRLGFGRRASQKTAKTLTPDESRLLDVLNNGALFCWDDPACGT